MSKVVEANKFLSLSKVGFSLCLLGFVVILAGSVVLTYFLKPDPNPEYFCSNVQQSNASTYFSSSISSSTCRINLN